MEKLLAMSIMSSTPSDIKSGGFSSSWMNFMSITKNSNQDSNNKNNDYKSNSKLDEKMESKKKKKEEQQNNSKASAWFAPEFDGLNCFETIVSH